VFGSTLNSLHWHWPCACACACACVCSAGANLVKCGGVISCICSSLIRFYFKNIRFTLQQFWGLLPKRGSRDISMALSHGLLSDTANLMMDHFRFKNKFLNYSSGRISCWMRTPWECVLIVSACKHQHVCELQDSIQCLTQCSIPNSTLFLGSCNHGDSLTTAVTTSLNRKYHAHSKRDRHFATVWEH